MIEVNGMVSIFDGAPLVQVSNTGPRIGQMSAADAKQMALQFFEAAVEAEREAGTVAFLRSKDFSDEDVGRFLHDMREHRRQATLRAEESEGGS